MNIKASAGLIAVIAVGALLILTGQVFSQQDDSQPSQTTDQPEKPAGDADADQATEVGSDQQPENGSEITDVSDPQEEHAGYLKLEREKIEREREALVLLKAEVKREIERLEAIRKNLDSRFAKVDEQRNKRIAKLVKIYQGMQAQEVVKLLDNLDEEIMLNVLYRMKAKNQSQILAQMEPARAAGISKKLIEGNLK